MGVALIVKKLKSAIALYLLNKEMEIEIYLQ
jgi:hypothetical protein